MQFTKLTTLLTLAALFCSALAAPGSGYPNHGHDHGDNDESHHGDNTDINTDIQQHKNTEVDQNTNSEHSKNAGMCSGDTTTYCCNQSNTKAVGKNTITLFDQLGEAMKMQCSQMPLNLPTSAGIGGALGIQSTSQETCKNEVFCCSGDKNEQTGAINFNMNYKCNKPQPGGFF